jgi:tetratricopeptide (TPR) repeat protein
MRLGLGDVAGADLAEADLSALVERVGHASYRWRIHAVRAMRASLAGDFATGERLIALIADLAREHDLPRAATTARFARMGLEHARRDPRALAAVADELLAWLAGTGRTDRVYSAWIHAALGRHDEARLHLAAVAHLTPTLIVTQWYAEAAAMLGDRGCIELALGYLEPGVLASPMAVGSAGALALGPSAIAAGDLYLALDRVEDAIAAYERGLALALRIGARAYVAIAERGLARARGPRSVHSALRVLPTLRRDGDRYVLRAGDREQALPDLKGMRYLELLLSVPGREVHVAELIGDDAGPSDAGPLLDATARRAYKTRLDDLAATLAGAEATNDIGRAERARVEIDALTEELARATGLGGRARLAGSSSERARINVQRRIRNALAKIAEVDSALARALDAAITTGTFCSFDGTLFRGE